MAIDSAGMLVIRKLLLVIYCGSLTNSPFFLSYMLYVITIDSPNTVQWMKTSSFTQLYFTLSQGCSNGIWQIDQSNNI